MPILNFHRYARLSRAVMTLGSMTSLALGAAACSNDLLSAPDPDLITPSDLDTPEGANALRIGALQRWRFSTGGDNTNGQESTWMSGGLLADEWATSSTFVENDQLDERRIKTDNATVTFDFRKLQRVRTAVDQALPYMYKWRPTETTNIAELYFARGSAEMQLASDFCNGIPLSDASTATSPSDIKYGAPQTVAQVFTTAIATLDSGLALATGTADSTVKIIQGLKITKARALLGLGGAANAAAAGALVAGIPTDSAYRHTYAATSGSNALWGQGRSARRYNVGDNLEGNAHDIPVANNLNFFSSKDPRVPSTYTITNGKDTTKSQDGLLFSRTTSLWSQESPVIVTSGIDARLIEAEAAFLSGNYLTATTGTLAILNTLRASPHTLGGSVNVAAMSALTDPGTDSARVAQLFREKAFWTFSRGFRLGDLRRLIRQAPYSTWFNAGNTFPSGTHYRGGTYGTDVNLPVPKDEENNNPNFHGCLDRNA
ncbi:MAG: hypothetical protein ACJ796_22315 [Gemmatimonadaceae bacterium]